MIIRTKEDFYSELAQNKPDKYIPMQAALDLPEIIHTRKLVLKDKASCQSAVTFINAELTNRKYKGFLNKEKNSDIHTCEVTFCTNVNTFAEEHDGIYGKDSIGIRFTDPDDGYNDWIWIAYEVLNDIANYDYTQYCQNHGEKPAVPEFEPPKPKVRKGFRIVRKTKAEEIWFVVQKMTWYRVWRPAITESSYLSNSVWEKRFHTFDEALQAYHRNFDIPVVDILTEEMA